MGRKLYIARIAAITAFAVLMIVNLWVGALVNQPISTTSMVVTMATSVILYVVVLRTYK